MAAGAPSRSSAACAIWCGGPRYAHICTASSPRGFAAPIAGAPALAADLPLAGAVERLRSAVAGFRAWDKPMAPHLVYGACSKSEYEQLHAMHFAEHLAAFR